MRLIGKTAIVTGAAQSIGAAVARRYAAEGAVVAIVDRARPELAEAVVDEINGSGGEAFFVQADVSREDEVRRMVREVADRCGTVHILVNNAGIDPRKRWTEITADDWDYVMGVNVRSQFLCAKAVHPYMQAQRYGKIVNVSSVTFFTGQANFVHYVASKGAVVGFTRALAREVAGDGITVNCLTPGAVLTETELAKVGAEALKEAERKLAERQSFARRETPADLEGAFVFLASPDSDFVTGQTLNVDGGWIMH